MLTECPDCLTITKCELTGEVESSIEYLPKNLAILEMEPFQKHHKSISSQYSEKDDQLCQFHHKKIEAFCNDDKQLLCIDCIIWD